MPSILHDFLFGKRYLVGGSYSLATGHIHRYEYGIPGWKTFLRKFYIKIHVEIVKYGYNSRRISVQVDGYQYTRYWITIWWKDNMVNSPKLYWVSSRNTKDVKTLAFKIFCRLMLLTRYSVIIKGK